jgi:uncharacterized protein YjbI with pentapeptide repeats
MPQRPDVSTSIQLNRVDNLVVSDSAIARIVLRDATTAGPVVMRRVSVIQDLDFTQAVFAATVSFDRVEVMEEVNFARSVIRDSVLFNTCIFRDEVSFDDSVTEASLVFEDSIFMTQLRFREMVVNAEIVIKATHHEGPITFERSAVNGSISVQGAAARDILLDEVNANAPISINDTTLSGLLSFRSGTYYEALSVQRSTFRAADLTKISAHAALAITDVTFEENVHLDGGAYFDSVSFKKLTFREDTVFNDSRFEGPVVFQDLTFQGRVEFGEVLFTNSVSFTNVIFEKSVSFRKAQFCAGVRFERVSFRDDVDFDLAAVKVHFQKALFFGQVSLRFGWADVVFEESDFPGPTRLGTSWLSYPLTGALVQSLGIAGKTVDDRRPTLLHLTGSNVSNTVLTDLNLKSCRFAGANNLDSLRIEQADPFSVTPNGWRFSRSKPFLAVWTSRGAIAEEHYWRIVNGLGIQKEGWLASPGVGDLRELVPQAESIQRIYRDLRKGREDQKDEPGAADFYYGEMEMRRHATQNWIERRVLDLYWLSSGYALRAWRAVMALIALLVVASIIFTVQGFDRNGGTALRAARVQPSGQVVYTKYALPALPHDFGTAFTYSIESATSLLSSPQPRPLTAIGQGMEFALRLLGPALLGLAVLSLRGRIKR